MKYRKLNINTLRPDIQKVINNIFPRIAPLNALIDQATKAGEITVDFAPVSVATKDGKWLADQRRILIDEHASIEDTVGSFIISLARAAHPALQKGAQVLMPEKFKNPSDYAQAVVKVDHEVMLSSYQIFRAIILNPAIVKLCNSNGLPIAEDFIEDFKKQSVPTLAQWMAEAKSSANGKPSKFDELCEKYTLVMKEKAIIEEEKRAKELQEKARKEQVEKAKRDAAAWLNEGAPTPSKQSAPKAAEGTRQDDIEPVEPGKFDLDGLEDFLNAAGQAQEHADEVESVSHDEEPVKPSTKTSKLQTLPMHKQSLAQKKEAGRARLQAAKSKFKF